MPRIPAGLIRRGKLASIASWQSAASSGHCPRGRLCGPPRSIAPPARHQKRHEPLDPVVQRLRCPYLKPDKASVPLTLAFGCFPFSRLHLLFLSSGHSGGRYPFKSHSITLAATGFTPRPEERWSGISHLRIVSGAVFRICPNCETDRPSR